MQKISSALLKAKKAFGPALKEKTNPAFRSKYADLGSCLEAVDQPCLDAGIVLYQETFEDATGVTVETVFLHESGESLRCGRLHVPASKQDPQGYGSALTYARRYSLITACGIAPEDDDGNAASRKIPAQNNQEADAQRVNWIADRKADIAAAKSVGELKKIMDAALEMTRQNKDQDAEDQLLEASAAKVAKAKAAKPPIATIPSLDAAKARQLETDDVPY